MALPLIIDYRFVDPSTNLGVVVDPDIVLEVWESGASSATVTRVLGTDAGTTIVESLDSSGYFYSTLVDVAAFAIGQITTKWFAKVGGINLNPYPAIETLEYPTPDALNFSLIKTYIFSKLGYPLVNVELANSAINTVIGESLRKYNRYVPRELTGTITLISNQNKYQLTNIPSRGVHRVTFVRKLPDTLFTSPYFGREFPRLGTIAFDEFVLGRMQLEQVRRTTGTDPDWRWDASTSTLYLTNGNYDGWVDPTQYYVEYRYYQDLSIEQVPFHHQDWFFRNCLAVAKGVLGEIRNKFSGNIPSPGGSMTVNGAQLLADSKEELAQADEDVRSMAWAVAPVVGGDKNMPAVPVNLGSTITAAVDVKLTLFSTVVTLIAGIGSGLTSTIFIREGEADKLVAFSTPQPSAGTLSITTGDVYIFPQAHTTLVVRSSTAGSVQLQSDEDPTFLLDLTPQRIRVLLLQKRLIRR
jgi:hypothetical protein